MTWSDLFINKFTFKNQIFLKDLATMTDGYFNRLDFVPKHLAKPFPHASSHTNNYNQRQFITVVEL